MCSVVTYLIMKNLLNCLIKVINSPINDIITVDSKIPQK